MGKVRAVVAAFVVLLASLVPQTQAPIRAQTVPTSSCSGQALTTPMQGHYTGTWHSTSDYVFDAKFHTFESIIHIPMTIDGTLDFTVLPNGQILGSADGKVDAPILHDGIRDISSGSGTIKGSVTGVFSSGSSLLILSHPVIDMYWGTFGGGANGHVERFITMPDYQLPVSGMDCISSTGTISEDGFPTQIIVPDGAPNDGPVSVPGVGHASGTWQLTSDAAFAFRSLSTQVDAFITAANTLVNGPSGAITPDAVNRGIVAPLQTLLAQIKGNPNVARCLLDRIGAWERSAIPVLFGRARALASATTPLFLRQAAEMLAVAGSLNAECGLPDDGATGAVQSALKGSLDSALRIRSWPDVAQFAREILLAGGGTAPTAVQSQLNAGLHSLVQSTADTRVLLDVGRVAYAAGDDTDVTLAMQRLNSHAFRILDRWSSSTTRKKATPKPKPKATATPKPKPTATPRPTATATPRPRTPDQVLTDGIKVMQAQATSGTVPTFSWQPVAGAIRYIVLVEGPDGPVWLWSGTSLSVPYGDTAIEGAPGTTRPWPLALPTTFTWSVLALDSSGLILGAKLRSGS